MDSMFWLFKQLVGVGLAIGGIALVIWLVVLAFMALPAVLEFVVKAVVFIIVMPFVIVARPFIRLWRWVKYRNVPAHERPSPLPPLFEKLSSEAPAFPVLNPLYGEPSDEEIERIAARSKLSKREAKAEALRRRALGYDN